MQNAILPEYMQNFTKQVFSDRNIDTLMNEIRKMGPKIMDDLQIEMECRFRYDFYRSGSINTTEKVFRRVREHYINQAAMGRMRESSSVSTDFTVNLNNFYKMRETTVDGKDLVIRSIKNGFFLDRESAKYGTKLTASMEIGGDSADYVIKKLARGFDSSGRKMFIRKKTRYSFEVPTIGGSYSVDLTEVESYESDFELAITNKLSPWLKTRDANPGQRMKSYEIELDYTVPAKGFPNIETMIKELNERIPMWCRYIVGMAKDVVYQTKQLVGETYVKELFRNVKERMRDTNDRRPLDISKRTLPQVRNITTKDLQSYEEYAATPKADGVRSLMYFGKNFVAIVKPPSEFNVVLVVDYDSPFEGLLLDGEFVETKNIRNETIKKTFPDGAYYVFDVVAPANGLTVDWNPNDVIERNNYLRAILPREFDKDAVSKKLILNRIPVAKDSTVKGWTLYTSHTPKNGLYFQVKEYEDASKTPYKAFLSYMGMQLQFEDDGLIFTPRYVPYHELDNTTAGIRTLKWKPEEKMTIDFLYSATTTGEAVNDNYEGVLKSSSNKELVPFVGTRFFPYDKNTLIHSDKYTLVNGAVYECEFRKTDKMFHVHRPRNDKEFPNTLEVAINDWYYINNPITAEIMTGVGYECIRETDKYRLWESLSYILPNRNKVLDLLNLDPRKDLPHEICKQIDLGNLPTELSKLDSWTKVHLFDTNNKVVIMKSQQDKLLDDVMETADQYDLLVLDGGMVQLINGDYKRYTDNSYLEKPVDIATINKLRLLLNRFYRDGKTILVHRMPVKKQELATTITYGTPQYNLILSPTGDGSVQVLFANNTNRPVSVVYDSSIQTTNPKSQKLFCRSNVQFEFEAKAGDNALSGDGLVIYYEWIRTGILTDDSIEKLFVAVDGSGWMIGEENQKMTADVGRLSRTESVSSGKFSIDSKDSFLRDSQSSSGVVSITLEDGETPAQYLIDYDEIEPAIGSLDTMIVKPILYRFSELVGKLPYNSNTAIRYAMEISEITLRDQDYQFIVDEFDIGIFKINTDKTSIGLEVAGTKADIIRSRYECKNGFMFIRRVDSGKYKLMIPSETKTLNMDNPYRPQHGMISASDPILQFFV